jgi:hypothetical protein
VNEDVWASLRLCGMDTKSNQRLHSVCMVMIVGMIAGTLFHAHQWVVEWAGYPWSTMLAKPEIRFSDFYDVLTSAEHRDPYSGWAIYFPLTYVLFYPLTFFAPTVACAVLFFVTVAALGIGLVALVKPATRGWRQSLSAAGILLGCSYPVWFCIDRGNIELVLLLLIGVFLYAYQRSHYCLGLIFLIPAICLKMYPAVFLTLFLAKGNLRYAFTAMLVVALLSGGSLWWFCRGPMESLALWQGNLHKFEMLYVIGDGEMGGSASMWNVAKLAWSYASLVEATWLQKPLPSPEETISQLKYMLRIYSVAMLALCGLVAWFVAFVEKEFLRKAALLFLLMITAPPAGADYKLVHAVGAVTALIMASGYRAGDPLPLILTAALHCPKKYWFFPNVITDMGTTDCSLGVAINPILIWAAAGFLIYQGFRERASAVSGLSGPADATSGLNLQ